jgi:hypothetical protein
MSTDKGGGGSTTTTNEPPAYQKGALQYGTNLLSMLAGQPGVTQASIFGNGSSGYTGSNNVINNWNNVVGRGVNTTDPYIMEQYDPGSDYSGGEFYGTRLVPNPNYYRANNNNNSGGGVANSDLYDPATGLPKSLLDYYAPLIEQDRATINALNSQEALAMNNPVTNATENEYMNIIQGKYLNSNPYLDAEIKKAQNSAIAQSNANWNASGRYGTAGNYRANVDSAGEIANNMYYKNYNDELNRMANTLGQGTAVQNMRYNDLDKLSDVGASREQYQAYLKNRPVDAVNRFLQSVSGNVGGSTTTRTDSELDPLGTILGGLLTGASFAAFL